MAGGAVGQGIFSEKVQPLLFDHLAVFTAPFVYHFSVLRGAVLHIFVPVLPGDPFAVAAIASAANHDDGVQ